MSAQVCVRSHLCRLKGYLLLCKHIPSVCLSTVQEELLGQWGLPREEHPWPLGPLTFGTRLPSDHELEIHLQAPPQRAEPCSSTCHSWQLLSKIISNSSSFKRTYSYDTKRPKVHISLWFPQWNAELMQYFSNFIAKMTRTQNSQNIMQDNATFFLFLHICIYGSPVSHRLLCSVIIIRSAIFYPQTISFLKE